MISSHKILAGTTLVCSLIVGSVLILQYNLIPPLSERVHFETIDQGVFCGITARINYVIEDLESWDTVWTNMHNTSSAIPNLPDVNFTSEVVFAVFLGLFYTGGYSAEITRIESTEGGLTVHIKETHPGDSCGVFMALTQPFHIVKASVDWIQSVEFVYSLIIQECPWTI